MNQKVLVADDSIASQRLFEMVLTREGYDVITLDSGAQVLDTIREKHPDIALIDSIMPDVDGYQICKTLKENADFSQLPIILLAGRYEGFDREKGMNIVGPEAILNKPSKAEDIVAKVKEFLAETGEEEIEEMTVAEEVTPSAAEVIEEPAFVQEEYEFDEDSEEADLVVENELLEEGAEIVEIEEMEEEVEEAEELEEVEEDEEGFTIEETETPPTQPAAPIMEPAVPIGEPVSAEATAAAPEISQIPDEQLDQFAEQLAQRLAQKLVPALMQQIAVYVMQFPAVNTLVEEMSKQLVKELLPEIQQKK